MSQSKKKMNDWSRVHKIAAEGDVSAFTTEDLTLNCLTVLTTSKRNAMHLAVYYGRLEMVVFLYRHCPQLAQQVDSTQMTILHHACFGSNSFAFVKQVLSYCDDNTILKLDQDGHSALVYAAKYLNRDAIDLLVSSQPDLLTIVNPKTGYPLLQSCIKERNFVIACYLVDLCPQITQLRTWKAKTALHCAVKTTSTNLTHFLVSADATMLAARNNSGHTPFLQAVFRNDVKQMNYLLDKWPKVIEDRDDFEYNALHMTWSAEFTQKLLQMQPDLARKRTKAGDTALQYTVNDEDRFYVYECAPKESSKIDRSDWRKKCNLLLRNQPDWVDTGSDKLCSLHLAVQCHDDDVIKYVFSCFPERVNWPESNGETPFDFAVCTGNEFAINLFCPQLDIEQAFLQCQRNFFIRKLVVDLSQTIEDEFTNPLLTHLLPELLNDIHDYLALPPPTKTNKRKRLC